MSSTIQNKKLPRGYLSYTQLRVWEYSPEEYVRAYLLGEERPTNEYMALGKKVAEALEGVVKPDDVAIETIKMTIPKYHYHEYEFRVDCPAVINGKKIKIPLLGKFDCYSTKQKIGEVKSGQKWTQADADNLDQLTFYAYIYWLKYQKIPALWLHWAETKRKQIETEDGTVEELIATGFVKNFKTKRTIKDFLGIHERIVRAYMGITETTGGFLSQIL